MASIPKDLDVEMSIELLGFIGLPLMQDTNNRNWKREMLFRILKGFDPNTACTNLTMFESKIAVWLNLPSFGDHKKINLTDYLNTLDPNFVV